MSIYAFKKILSARISPMCSISCSQSSYFFFSGIWFLCVIENWLYLSKLLNMHIYIFRTLLFIMKSWIQKEYLLFNFTRLKYTILAIDNDFKISSSVIHYNMSTIVVVNNLITHSTRNTCCIEYPFILPWTQRNQSLNSYL